MLAAAALFVLMLSASCGQQTPPQELSELVGKQFPTVRAKDLNDAWVSAPADWKGTATIVLVTPSKQSQPDADKWIADLRERSDVAFRETPIIDSSVAHLIADFIKDKMKDGLPKDMWPRVIPVFEGAGDVKAFFGDQGQTKAWVVVLDDAGAIRWFHADGYTAEIADQTVAKLQQLSQQAVWRFRRPSPGSVRTPCPVFSGQSKRG
jgi:hypothetical protein